VAAAAAAAAAADGSHHQGRHPTPHLAAERETESILEGRGTGGQLQTVMLQTRRRTRTACRQRGARQLRKRRAPSTRMQPRVLQPQRAAMGSFGVFKSWPSPAPDDHRIRVGGAEPPRERPLPAPRTSVGSPRATNPPLFVRRRRRPRELGLPRCTPELPAQGSAQHRLLHGATR